MNGISYTVLVYNRRSMLLRGEIEKKTHLSNGKRFTSTSIVKFVIYCTAKEVHKILDGIGEYGIKFSNDKIVYVKQLSNTYQ